MALRLLGNSPEEGLALKNTTTSLRSDRENISMPLHVDESLLHTINRSTNPAIETTTVISTLVLDDLVDTTSKLAVNIPTSLNLSGTLLDPVKDISLQDTLNVHQLDMNTPSSAPPVTTSVHGPDLSPPSGLVPVSVCSPSCRKGFRKAIRPGKPICCFQCFPCRLGEISNQTDSIECFKCPWDQWSNDNRDQCIPKNTDFLSYEEPFGAILAASSIFSSVIPVIIIALFFCYRNTPIVKANNTSLSFLLLMFLTLCCICPLTFIGYPTEMKCLLRQAAFGITFALCVSCILAKTVMVVIAFKATKPNSNLRRWVGPQLSYTIIIAGTLIQVVLCALWLVFSPPFSEYNIHIHPWLIIVQCNEGSPIAFWCMLGYLGFLATLSFIMAFLARNLPDSFNEARFITFSMLAFLSVWLSFIPAYLSTRGKYMVAMEIFAILSSSSSLISCLFFPKCYIILFKSEINTKEYLMGQHTGRSMKVKKDVKH
ncbi:vomeronasal type-2 receptor 26-like [Lissotriton helveticus]